MKINLILAAAAVVVLSGCATTQGPAVISSINLGRALATGSYSGQGLNERVLNCLAASIDTNRRGGPCSR